MLSVREKVTHAAYKERSNAKQRAEACCFAEAVLHNSGVTIENQADEYRLLAEIERNALLLILARDEETP